ncbi:hypothetical protein [Bacillus sp. 1P06AnD]|uniref:hypothetical protein n=1 Tax=Bacillus sp. 1P06AnD TaxID=3132208 RepID=UPI0039A208BE
MYLEDADEKKKGKKYIYSAIVTLISLFLSACTSSPNVELYEGGALRIAVVGKAPEVKEESVKFTEITFEQVTNEDLKPYDAVFITEKNLFEAAESQYDDVYLHSTIPLFFIGTHNDVPFTEKDLGYNQNMN